MEIVSITQFGFSAYTGSADPPKGAIPGWTSVSGSDSQLGSVPNASTTAPAQVFNAYVYELPPNTPGQGVQLQSLSNGKYVRASQQTVAGTTRTVFTADADTRGEAAAFAIYSLSANLAFLWQDPEDSRWYGLVNLDVANDGTGIVIASSVGFDKPYLLPWPAAQTNPNWTAAPPGDWDVANGSDLSWVDFTCLSTTDFPYDFTNCRLNNADLSGKTFGFAKFVGCELSTTVLQPPLGATDSAPIDFTRATINYPSLGPDWRNLNLTYAVINDFPKPPEPPPAIDARGTILDFVNMIQWNLAKADFTGASLCNANFNGSYLTAASFHGATLSPPTQTRDASPANFAFCYLFDADFSNASAQGVSFAHAFLFGLNATVSGASLREADFTDAFLPELDFSGVAAKDLTGATFDGACLAGANFQGTLLGKMNTRGFSFVGAALQGTDFTGSNLLGANLTNAAIATAPPPGQGTKLTITTQYKLETITVSIQPITYTRATTLAPTDATTYCPSHTGPCTGVKLAPEDKDQSPQVSWPPALARPEPPMI
jgi:uncharacterized protein YjbI with pentapeptide repeats